MSVADNIVEVDWDKVEDAPFSGLKTGIRHKVQVKRESIPIILVPGIMGTVLRRAGTDGEGRGDDGLPNMRWNPSSTFWLVRKYFGSSGEWRKNMLVGESFDENFLEPHDEDPVGNGFQAVAESFYHPFLFFLQNADNFGPLNKIFDFPIYAFGYNWSDSNLNSGNKLVKRIDEIIAETKKYAYKCEKVILVTHSMGGLVSRAASESEGGRDKILGIIHGVQPSTGAPEVYWRAKGGAQSSGGIIGRVTSSVLGASAKKAVPMLGHLPGPLELLPNKHYQDNDGSSAWLTVTHNNNTIISLPKSDPFKEIYRIPGTGDENLNPGRHYWGLIDPDLLSPGNDEVAKSVSKRHRRRGSTKNGNGAVNNNGGLRDELSNEGSIAPWDQYLSILDMVEQYQQKVDIKVHPDTHTFHGIGHESTDRILMEVESYTFKWQPYQTRGFCGYFTDKDGRKKRAELSTIKFDGDETVPVSSATGLDDQAADTPPPTAFNVTHGEPYNNADVRAYCIRAITALCANRYEEVRGKKLR
ncbi:esterase/lipase family protein [Agarilytica rhodophyticola]|uniref:esterase/lipase family protein n=1 Tax=Agarilytica rhodophyticola TaxID=1737490 RepID=UPI000B349F09|nr:hypothetical protein [Agarilytica rhodophyticola]